MQMSEGIDALIKSGVNIAFHRYLYRKITGGTDRLQV